MLPITPQLEQNMATKAAEVFAISASTFITGSLILKLIFEFAGNSLMGSIGFI
jgi:hypothetical protein